MNLTKIKEVFKNNGCSEIYIKELSSNDNSKNQVYLGGNFDALNIFPISEITIDSSGDWKKERFKASLNFCWITSNGELSTAPKSQLILYPKYPEVRFSGFLSGCKNAPSDLMNQRTANRLLLLSVSNDGRIIGFVTSPYSELAKEFQQNKPNAKHGIFYILDLQTKGSNRSLLINELKRINKLGWIESKRLNKEGQTIPCNASNCGGYTLEAELGIIPNGISEPDFLGWEIKQFGVSNFKNIYSKIITLMTPEPDGGEYKNIGVKDFLKNYGYPDKMGRKDRINFGGVHRVNQKQKTTNLTLTLIGFDFKQGKIRNSDGRVALVDTNNIEAASWSFASLLKHWNRKHRQACYIPSLSEKNPSRKYKYGNKVILGIGTNFGLFLNEMHNGNIYYDPGIKMENVSTRPKIKRRSQFRVKSGNIPKLYSSYEEINVNE